MVVHKIEDYNGNLTDNNKTLAYKIVSKTI